MRCQHFFIWDGRGWGWECGNKDPTCRPRVPCLIHGFHCPVSGRPISRSVSQIPKSLTHNLPNPKTHTSGIHPLPSPNPSLSSQRLQSKTCPLPGRQRKSLHSQIPGPELPTPCFESLEFQPLFSIPRHQTRTCSCNCAPNPQMKHPVSPGSLQPRASFPKSQLPARHTHMSISTSPRSGSSNAWPPSSDFQNPCFNFRTAVPKLQPHTPTQNGNFPATSFQIANCRRTASTFADHNPPSRRSIPVCLQCIPNQPASHTVHVLTPKELRNILRCTSLLFVAPSFLFAAPSLHSLPLLSSSSKVFQ